MGLMYKEIYCLNIRKITCKINNFIDLVIDFTLIMI